MNPVATRPVRRNVRLPMGTAAYAVAGVAALAVLLPLLGALRSHDVRHGLTVTNPSPWLAEVDVDRPGEAPALRLGGVAPEASVTFDAVLEQGERWVFRFSYGGEDPVEVVLDRAALEQAGWSVTVPETFARRMRAARIPPSA